MFTPTARNSANAARTAKNVAIKIGELVAKKDEGKVWRVKGLGERGLRFEIVSIDAQTGKVQIQSGDDKREVDASELVHNPIRSRVGDVILERTDEQTLFQNDQALVEAAIADSAEEVEEELGDVSEEELKDLLA